jgi:hypothetical protein
VLKCLVSGFFAHAAKLNSSGQYRSGRCIARPYTSSYLAIVWLLSEINAIYTLFMYVNTKTYICMYDALYVVYLFSIWGRTVRGNVSVSPHAQSVVAQFGSPP